MAKQELLDKLLSDANARAQDIVSDAKAKADALVTAAEEERTALTLTVRRTAEATSPDTLKRARSMAELEVRKIALSRKQTAISEAYAAALDVVRKDSRYEALIVKMISSVAEEGDEVIFAAADKVNVNSILGAVKKETGLALKASAERGDFAGGIVLRGAACDKNLTLEVELEALRSAGGIKYDTLFK